MVPNPQTCPLWTRLPAGWCIRSEAAMTGLERLLLGGGARVVWMGASNGSILVNSAVFHHRLPQPEPRVVRQFGARSIPPFLRHAMDFVL